MSCKGPRRLCRRGLFGGSSHERTGVGGCGPRCVTQSSPTIALAKSGGVLGLLSRPPSVMAGEPVCASHGVQETPNGQNRRRGLVCFPIGSSHSRGRYRIPLSALHPPADTRGARSRRRCRGGPVPHERGHNSPSSFLGSDSVLAASSREPAMAPQVSGCDRVENQGLRRGTHAPLCCLAVAVRSKV